MFIGDGIALAAGFWLFGYMVLGLQIFALALGLAVLAIVYVLYVFFGVYALVVVPAVLLTVIMAKLADKRDSNLRRTEDRREPRMETS